MLNRQTQSPPAGFGRMAVAYLFGAAVLLAAAPGVHAAEPVATAAYVAAYREVPDVISAEGVAEARELRARFEAHEPHEDLGALQTRLEALDMPDRETRAALGCGGQDAVGGGQVGETPAEGRFKGESDSGPSIGPIDCINMSHR